MLLALIVLIAGQSTADAQGTETALVTVNAGVSLGVLPATEYGVNTATYDAHMFDPQIPGLLTDAGTRTLRYPGGSWSDDYHWQTNSGTAGSGVNPNPNDDFDHFMTAVAQPIGAQPIITVNYGSNAAGTAGGDPNEAAAWVRYANVTHSYGVRYWEIGNEIYGNGYYSGMDWETDLHDLDQTAADRVGNANLSPTTYGQNVNTYVNAMKAQDPTIQVGAVMNLADGTAETVDWNTKALAQCGPNIDFVIMHWYPEYGNDDDATLLADPESIATYVANMRAQIDQYCGANAPNVRIFVTETNSDATWTPGKQIVSLVNADFAADETQTWLENGVSGVGWWDMHNGTSTTGDDSSSLYGNTTWGDEGILSCGVSPEPAAETPFPPYFGFMMLGTLGSPGDTMVSSASSESLLKVHSVLRADGSLAVMLLNDDPDNNVDTTLSWNDYLAAGPATVYSYVEGPAIGGAAPTISAFPVTVTGSTFGITVTPYSETTIILGGAAPTFTSTASTPASVTEDSQVTISTTVTDTGAPLSNGTVLVNLLDSSGNIVATQSVTGQSFSSGQTIPLTFDWTAPGSDGTYTVTLGVFNANNTVNYYANNSNAASFTVTGAPPVFTANAAAAPSIQVNTPVTIVNTVTCTGSTSTSADIQMDIMQAGTLVARESWPNETFTSGQQTQFSFMWTPTATGTYTVELGVFGPKWTPNYVWNSSAATIGVNAGDPAQYSFENGVQGWISSGTPVTSAYESNAEAFLGSQSLAINFDGPAGTTDVYVPAPAVPAGATVNFHVWVPAGSPIDWLQAYIEDQNMAWTSNWQSIDYLVANAWNTITLVVPANAAVPLNQIGVQFNTTAAWTGECYIDSVAWGVEPVHVLWSSTNGMLSLWNFNPSTGSFTQNSYGPFPGWSASAIADGPDGLTRVLWVNTGGAASIWSVDPLTGALTQNTFGPYPGWSATALSAGADNTTHVLWSSTKGASSLWNYSTITGGFTQNSYGPYADWSARSVADGPDGMTRMLWVNPNGAASIWSVDSTTGALTQNSFGPFPGWNAAALAVNYADTTHVLWTNSGGAASVWNYSTSTGAFTQNTYGPFAGWSAASLADGPDENVQLLWDSTSGSSSIWDLDNVSGAFTPYTFGPFPGWTTTAITSYP